MNDRLKDKKFKLVTVCVDKTMQYDKAVEILKSKSATMTNFWVSDEHIDKMAEEWGFALFPAVYMFDQSGKKVLDNPDVVSVEMIEKQVVKLLEAG